MAKRKGLNTTLAYAKGGQRHTYRVRTNLLSHGMKIIFDESQSRVRRSFYPHRLSSAQFTLGIELKGEAEYKSFSNWMATYAEYLLNPNVSFKHYPSMSVSLPSYDFSRKGVPLTGFEWGDRVGGMIWTPQITFETSEEPLDRHKKVAISSVKGLQALTNRTSRYFYPTGVQLSGGQAPPDGTYAKVITAADVAGPARGGKGGRGEVSDSWDTRRGSTDRPDPTVGNEMY